MRRGAWQTSGTAVWLVPALLGMVAGTAVQTLQAALLPRTVLAVMFLTGLAGLFVLWRAAAHSWLRWSAMLLSVAAIVFPSRFISIKCIQLF